MGRFEKGLFEATSRSSRLENHIQRIWKSLELFTLCRGYWRETCCYWIPKTIWDTVLWLQRFLQCGIARNLRCKILFTSVDFGQCGSTNDSGVLRNSGLYKAFEENKFNVPAPTEVEGLEDPLHYFLLEYEIFSLKTCLVRTFLGSVDDSQKTFNYWLSRNRSTIENAFGILVGRWQIFKWPIRASIETVRSMIGTCVFLQNYFQTTQSSPYTPQGFIDVEGFHGVNKERDWRNIIKNDIWCIKKFHKKQRGKVSYDPKVVWSSLKAYLNSAFWQGKKHWDYIKITGPSRKS